MQVGLGSLARTAAFSGFEVNLWSQPRSSRHETMMCADHTRAVVLLLIPNDQAMLLMDICYVSRCQTNSLTNCMSVAETMWNPIERM